MVIYSLINVIWGGYDDNIKFVKDKAARVLIPYCVIGLSLCILQNRDVGQMVNGISHLWFLLAIFECYILGKKAGIDGNVITFPHIGTI